MLRYAPVVALALTTFSLYAHAQSGFQVLGGAGNYEYFDKSRLQLSQIEFGREMQKDLEAAYKDLYQNGYQALVKLSIATANVVETTTVVQHAQTIRQFAEKRDLLLQKLAATEVLTDAWAGTMQRACWAILTPVSGFAKNNRPSSGRPLQYGHWLTCWGGDGMRYRQSTGFSRNTPLEQVLGQPAPKFSGSYGFEVKDTWEEWVTHSGSDCGHCGETRNCSGSGKDEVCTSSCNYCSWQELETFYRPWSMQRTDWKVEWVKDAAYNQYQARRKKWWDSTSDKTVHKKEDLDKLFIFDPDRPESYHLFPGEAEHVGVSNNGSWGDGGSSITPHPYQRRSTRI